MSTIISKINSYLPGAPVPNTWLEKRIKVKENPVPPGLLSKIMGCNSRYYAAADEQVSDLAVKAALPILLSHGKNIDLLIFASACADLIEPATSNIIQYKLDLDCPAFDVKNACNSVLSAMEIANSFILAERAKNILIVSGEKPSDSICLEHQTNETFKNHFAAYSFGDGGIALLLTKSSGPGGIIYQKSKTYGKHWSLCTIQGGGSMFPRNTDKMFFTGQTFKLKNVIKDLVMPFIINCCAESGIELKEVDYVCTHQVAAGIYSDIANLLQIPLEKFIPLFHLYGNTASISVPLALEKVIKEKNAPPGSLIMLLGLAAGINLSVQFLRL